MRPVSRSYAFLPAFAIVLAACGAATEGTPMPTQSEMPVAVDGQSPTPSATPPGHASEPPMPSATPSAPGEEPSSTIDLDTVVRTVVSGLRLRERPTTGSASVGTLAEGSPSYVVDGPVAADGYTWYLVSGLGLPQYSGCSGPIRTDPWECPVWYGWIASASVDGDAWLEVAQPECPAAPDVVTYDITLAIQRIAYLACYGDDPWTMTGFYPLIPDDAGLGGTCAGVPDEATWIACNLGYEHIVPRESDQFGTGFVFSVDPQAVAMPDRGQWIRISGRFDHPAAEICTYGDDPMRTVLQCRAQFVADTVEVVAAP
jgi:hypothetical protein